MILQSYITAILSTSIPFKRPSEVDVQPKADEDSIAEVMSRFLWVSLYAVVVCIADWVRIWIYSTLLQPRKRHHCHSHRHSGILWAPTRLPGIILDDFVTSSMSFILYEFQFFVIDAGYLPCWVDVVDMIAGDMEMREQGWSSWEWTTRTAGTRQSGTRLQEYLVTSP